MYTTNRRGFLGWLGAIVAAATTRFPSPSPSPSPSPPIGDIKPILTSAHIQDFLLERRASRASRATFLAAPHYRPTLGQEITIVWNDDVVFTGCVTQIETRQLVGNQLLVRVTAEDWPHPTIDRHRHPTALWLGRAMITHGSPKDR